MSAVAPVASAAPIVRPRLSRDDWIMRTAMLLLGGALVAVVVLPLASMFIKSLQDRSGAFVGGANFAAYFSTPALFYSIYNSLTVSVITTVIVITISFGYAYALTRTCMPWKPLFRAIALIPILAPSLLPAISLVYLFGNQGFVKGALMGETIYGPIGIVIGSAFWTLPHALIILVTALSLADGRLYEAAVALRASRLRTFFTVTLPGAKYGLISAIFVVFTLVITDFGVPKVIGGQYNVLATDIYKQVIGQQNFQMGAVVSVVLLAPAVLAFAIDRLVQRKQVALLSARAVPYEARPQRARDWTMFGFCSLVALAILTVIGTAAYASFVKYWPYNLSFTLRNYRFDLVDGGGWSAYRNSIEMAAWTAVIGTMVVFSGAYLVEKGRGFTFGGCSSNCSPCCRSRCRAWCSGWPTSSSSTRRGTHRATSSTAPWRFSSSAPSRTSTPSAI